MLMTTTNNVEGRRILHYYGIVSGETIIGANMFRDLFYEEVLRKAKDSAMKEMCDEAMRLGANAVIGIDLDFETVGGNGSMLMVTASGTAVYLE